MLYRIIALLTFITFMQFRTGVIANTGDETDSLLSLLSHTNEPKRAEILNELAYLLWQDNNTQSIEYAKKALLLSEKYNLPYQKYNALQNLATACQMHDTLNESLQYNFKALKVAYEMNDSLLIARSHFGLGSNYSQKGYYEDAMEHMLQALKIVEDSYYKADTTMNSRRLSFITNNIGALFNRMGNTDKALEYYNYSLGRKTVLNDLPGVANTLNNIGLLYAERGEFEKAEMYYQRSLEIKDKMGKTADIAETVFNRWELMIKQKKYSEALTYFYSVEKIFSGLDSRSRILMFNNLASVYLALDMPDNAYINIKNAIELAKKISTIELLSQSYLLLSEYHFETSDLKNAYVYQNKYIELKDSVMSIEMVSKMAEMQTKYESKKKENQIVILQKDKQINLAELDRQKAIKLVYAVFSIVLFFLAVLIIVWIRGMQKGKRELLEKRNLENEQKLLRAQMNPHFIFNSLNSVQGFISANDSFKAMSFLSKFGQLLRNILENSRKNLIELKNELETLRLYIEMEKLRYKHIFDYEILVDEKLDLESIMVPPLIIQPFVENAIKHGLSTKKEKGKLLIDVRKEKKHIYIKIEDNGVGRKRSNELRKSAKNHHNSFGVELTNERLKNLGKATGAKASLNITDSKDDNGDACGTIVVLMLPYWKPS